MKPDCQQVLTQFASFSVEELSDSEAASLLHHLEECEPCKGQWLLFEKTLTVVTQSGPRDADVEQHRSQQMWLVCMEHARQNDAKKHLSGICSANSAKGKHHSIASGSEAGDSRDSITSKISRSGKTVVGSALLMLASSYWLAPHVATTDVVAPAKAQIIAAQASYSVAPLVDYGSTLRYKSQIAASSISAPTKNVVSAMNFQSR